MNFEYVSPQLPRHVEAWLSPSLGIEMPVVHYGRAGLPVLLFPTAAADFLENERFFLVKAIEPLILTGRVQVFSIDSINRLAWMEPSVPVPEQARRQGLYARYLEHEVAPFIRARTGDPGARAVTAGASFGAFHAANALFRRPDLWGGLIAMSGFYDLGPDYLRGFMSDDAYYNNPMSFLPGLGGEYLERLRRDCRIVVATGQGAYEVPEASVRLARVLEAKGIPHLLDVWGHDVNHDWPWWRKMLPHFLGRIVG